MPQLVQGYLVLLLKQLVNTKPCPPPHQPRGSLPTLRLFDRRKSLGSRFTFRVTFHVMGNQEFVALIQIWNETSYLKVYHHTVRRSEGWSFASVPLQRPSVVVAQFPYTENVRATIKHTGFDGQFETTWTYVDTTCGINLSACCT